MNINFPSFSITQSMIMSCPSFIPLKTLFSLFTFCIEIPLISFISLANIPSNSLPVETSRFVFAQSPYFSSWASKSNLDGAQEPNTLPTLVGGS